MRVLVMNWAMHRSVSWIWHMFVEMSKQLGYEFDILSARNMWIGRGGGRHSVFEEEGGVRIYRLFESIQDYRSAFGTKMKEIKDWIEPPYDFVMCFHQSNIQGGLILKQLLNRPLILLVENASRLSGIQKGKILENWKYLRGVTDGMISWAPMDKEYQGRLGSYVVPTGVITDPSKYMKSYEVRKRNGVMCYAGSIMSSGWKSSQSMSKDIPRIFEQTPIKKLLIMGPSMDDQARDIIDELKSRYRKRIEWINHLPRENCLKRVGASFCGYFPTNGNMICNFVIESVGIGVPVYMPYATKTPVPVVNQIKQINRMWNEPEFYHRHSKKGRVYFEKNHDLPNAMKAYDKTWKDILCSNQN